MAYYLIEILLFVATLSVVAAAFIKHRYNYWKRRNIPYLKPTFPKGNNTTFLPRGIAIGLVSKGFYDEFKKLGVKIGGVFLGLEPRLVICDPDIAKDVLTTDFSHFVDRGIYKTESDPITVHILSQTGQEWKTARSKSSPLFTSVKMKTFLESLKNIGEEMVTVLEKSADNNSDVDMQEILACYTTDSIGSAVFGLECNSLRDPNAEFRKFGRHLFGKFSIMDQVKLFLTINLPKIAETLRVSNIQSEVTDFFVKMVVDLVKYREEHGIKNNDYLQMLIDMKKTSTMTLDEIIGQTFVFYVGGFETSSTTATMALFELAENPETQDRLRNELEECMKKHDNKITYEALMELEYLNAVLKETLRKWPALASLTRVCVKDYTFRNTDITIKKDTTVIIPVRAFQMEADYYENPTKFDPDRFMDKDASHPGYFPFGDGPRMCIGVRFAQMQLKLALLAILRKYRVYKSPRTITPLIVEPDTFVLHTTQRVYLRLEKL